MQYISTINKSKDINKIIGASFGRTGTTSLRKALELMGFGPCYHMHELFSNPQHIFQWEKALERKPNALKNLMRKYKSMVDFPVCSYYKELYEMFPGSKVLLTYRDPEEWYDSISSTIFQIDWANWNPEQSNNILIKRVGSHNEKLINVQTFGNLLSDKDFCIRIYTKHIKDVKDNIPENDILFFDLTKGWKPLCNFLKAKTPKFAFPYENKRKSFNFLIQNSVINSVSSVTLKNKQQWA